MERKLTLVERQQEAKRTGRPICFRKSYLLRSVYYRYVDTYVHCRRFCKVYDLCKLEEGEEDEVVVDE